MSGPWDGPACYEILLAGTPDARWEAWFDGLRVEALPDGLARITGTVTDQPALHGLLERIRDGNLILVGLRRLP